MSDRRGELVKLARVLDLPPDVLAHLALDADSLRSVREALSASLFDASRPTMQRVAKASKLLPNGTVARVGEHVFGPLLCARIVGLLAPEHAIDLALRMPDEFLADTSALVDPRQAQTLIAAMPTERVVEVAGRLVERGDYVTLARFVDFLSRETIEAVIASIRDELVLLHIAAFVESQKKLTELVGLIPRTRLRAMIVAVGATGGPLWLEALALTEHLDQHWKQTIGDLAAELDAAVLQSMLYTARDYAAWDSVLPLIVAMSEWAQQRFIELPGIDDVVLVGLLGAADRLGLWQELLPIVPKMPLRLREMLATLLGGLPTDVIDRILTAADPHPWLTAAS
ncbi:MAG TPA: hypothetical protein VFV99_04890 [Kofleriaceae bacterium]|nr:hypothetical protein [Kofleriaceae bacterium]